MTIFEWDGFDVVEDEDPEEIPVYENATEYNEDESQPEVVILITQYEQKGAPEFQNTQPFLPSPVQPVYQYTSLAIPVPPIYYNNNDDDDLTRFYNRENMLVVDTLHYQFSTRHS